MRSFPSILSIAFAACAALCFPAAWCAPTFTSGPSVSQNPSFYGQTLTFTAAATDGNFIVGYSWDFGDESNATGASVTHMFPGATTFTVTVKASSVNGNTSATLTVNVVAPVIGEGPDSDGDGFSDSYEKAVGSDPNDPKSTPLGGAPATPPSAGLSLKVTKGQFKLTFNGKGTNSIKLSGTIQAPSTFTGANRKFLVSVGNYSFPFSLSAKGKSSVGKSSMTVATKGKAVKGTSARLGTGIMEYNWNVTISEPKVEDPLPYPFEPPATEPQIPDLDQIGILAGLELFGFIDEDLKSELTPFGCPFWMFDDEGDFFDFLMYLNYKAEQGKSGSASLTKAP